MMSCFQTSVTAHGPHGPHGPGVGHFQSPLQHSEALMGQRQYLVFDVYVVKTQWENRGIPRQDRYRT